MTLEVSERDKLHQQPFNTIDIQKVAKENNRVLLNNLKVILNTETHIVEDRIPVDKSKRVLIGLVKSDNVEHYIDHSAKIYYTGKRFPATIALNKLYYFMPYMKGMGVRDLYFIKIVRVGKKSEVHPNCDDNDLRLVFEIEFIKQLFTNYLPIHLNIWRTFTDTILGKLLKLNDIEEIC